MEFSFTPIAFFTVNSGLYIGTGWNIPGLAYGMARLNYNGFYKGQPLTLLENDDF